jgi:hypothetical protein
VIWDSAKSPIECGRLNARVRARVLGARAALHLLSSHAHPTLTSIFVVVSTGLTLCVKLVQIENIGNM